MKHGIKFRKLGRDGKHRRAMLRNLTTALVKHDVIKTTLHRAKELSPIADKMVTIAKKGGLDARRKLGDYLFEREAVNKAFTEFPQRYANRAGGYTRITPIVERRLGDGAKMAIIEYIDYEKIPKATPTIVAEQPIVTTQAETVQQTKSNIDTK